MATPLVSVLLTLYNREQYLAQSIESVLAQSFGDFELIVVDDQSSDRSVEIARQYERADSRVRVTVNQRNLGDYGNRNFAASLANGQYLKFHDSDDVMYSHCLAVMVPPMEAEPRAGFGLSNGRYWPGGPMPMLLSPRQAYQREFLGQGLFMCGPASALFRTKVFRDLGGFENHGAASDTIFWARACARYPVLLLPADLFYYREHAGQELQAPRAARAYATVPAYMWQALAVPDCPLDERERAIARRNVAFSTAKSAWQAVKARNFALAWYRLAGSGITPAEWIRYLRSPRRSAHAGVSP
ncbi:MAG: hypothetical protein DMF87_13125 [Acidobacteria bacterium]|nr:MAG: hypothetical protein DMF87_13125 [Acidobacteriota bacterium]